MPTNRSGVMSRCFQRRYRPACITVVVLGFVIAAILLAFVAFGEEENPHATLRFVSVLFRHGARTPRDTYPKDPHRDDRVWPEGWGQLTKEGKMQMYRLGQFLRMRYNGYLSDLYIHSEMTMKSSALDRCLMSAELVLAGLYPPVGHQVWNDELHWQPIPVHSTPRDLDQLINVKKPCPRYEEELDKASKSPVIREIDERSAEMYEYLSTHTGIDIRNVTAVENLYNTLEIEKHHGLALPEWTNKYFPEKMKRATAMGLAIHALTTTMKRLVGGPFVGEVSRNMETKLSSEKFSNKIMLYAGHDLTIVNVWRTLGFTDLIKPDFGAALFFELHVTRSGTNHEVKLLYRNNTATRNLFILNMPNCGQPCHLDTFLALTRPVVPVDWDNECHTTSQ